MKTVTIMIPSRNRFELLKSVLKFVTQINSVEFNLNVIISDNSDIPYSDFAAHNSTRIIRAPERLLMPQHWEWMISQVESDYYCILTDRSLVLPDNFSKAVSTLIKSESELISYSFAGYSDHYFPYFVGGMGYTNKCYNLN
jgi:hypothetical protein